MRIDKLAMTSREALQTAMSTAADAQAGAGEPIHPLPAQQMPVSAISP